jgi:hypothetical protein
MKRLAPLLALVLLALALPAAAHAAGVVQAGAAVVDGTYHVGNSAGQYAPTRDGGYGDYDPHLEQVKNQASYGVQARESVRALVVKGTDGTYVALVSDDHYIPQDALFKRTAQLVADRTGGAINAKNLTMAVTHNHSSPSYSSIDWGVWAFQDVFDFRFYDYYARQNAAAIAEAFEHLHDVRVSATALHFDKFQKNPMGPGRADDGSPAGFPRDFTDHDLSVVRFENIDGGVEHAKPLATLVNIGQHPEMLEGYNLITSEFVGATERFVDRTIGGVTIFTQNATGTSEVEEEYSHGVHEREAFNHTQYNQMEWGARQLSDAIIRAVREQIDPQTPNPDDSTPMWGGTSYHDRFIGWMSHFEVGMEDRWFPGPVSHPYPGVSSCRTDPAFAGSPRVPVVGLPDCEEVPIGSSLMPVTSQLPGGPGIDTDTFEALGIPVPENYSFPSTEALEDTLGLHLQAFRLGDILFTVCACEQWVDQAYNIKTRTDKQPGNEWLGFDPTADYAAKSDDPLMRANSCTPNDDGTHLPDGSGSGTWTCTTSGDEKLSDRLIERMRARITNDAAGWDDPTCAELGCGLQAESEPTDLTKIRGNYTHDDTPDKPQGDEYAQQRGYTMVVPISMANDYNGYIATYRDYMTHDHYRKALTGWGPHSSDYIATRLARLGHALKGDEDAQLAVDAETDPAVAAQHAPEYVPGAAKEVADQAAEEAKVRAVGEAAAAGVQAYALTLPDDGLGAPGDTVQPKDIERFDAATFTWVGGNNYTDMPRVTVERRTGDGWDTFADQSGEVPISLRYPGSDPTALATYRTGGQVWRWTATFEAMVNRFDLVDPQGDPYRATPPGTYRFVVHGQRRSGNADAPYTIVSDPFEVEPWHGITIDDVQRDGGTITFSAGPSHTVQESHIRGSSTPRFNDGKPLTFTIGPVDFPDHAADQKATGFRFLDTERGYSAFPTPDPANAEHYCLDCRFRDWLDATGDLVAHVTYRNGDTVDVPAVAGRFTVPRRDGGIDVVVEDRWGDDSGPPEHVEA